MVGWISRLFGDMHAQEAAGLCGDGGGETEAAVEPAAREHGHAAIKSGTDRDHSGAEVPERVTAFDRVAETIRGEDERTGSGDVRRFPAHRYGEREVFLAVDFEHGGGCFSGGASV